MERLVSRMFTVDEARQLLTTAGLFFEPDPEEGMTSAQVLNLNDAFYWACADAEKVPDDELQKLATLFWQYGQCGVYYWVLERRGDKKVEFVDVNRFVEFVRAEEAIRVEEPSSSKRAYLKRQYTIGECG